MSQLFDVTILFAGGAKHTIRSMSKFKIEKGTYSWESAGRDRILDFQIEKIEAVFYSIVPWYTRIFRFFIGA